MQRFPAVNPQLFMGGDLLSVDGESAMTEIHKYRSSPVRSKINLLSGIQFGTIDGCIRMEGDGVRQSPARGDGQQPVLPLSGRKVFLIIGWLQSGHVRVPPDLIEVYRVIGQIDFGMH